MFILTCVDVRRSGNDFSGERIWPGVTWRPFAVVCSLPAVAALLLTFFALPESPRFLVGKKKFDEAVNHFCNQK